MPVEMNMPAPIYIGADYALNFTIIATGEDEDDENATPENITGWALAFHVRNYFADVSALITKTTVSGISIVSGTAGTLTVTLTDTDTETLSPGVYYFSLWRTDDGSETPLTTGKLTARRSARQ